jgi:hypothetical protein
LKGIVFSTDKRAIAQAVGKRVDIAMEEPWGDRTPRTRLVAIGAHGAVDEPTLREIFNGRSEGSQMMGTDARSTLQPAHVFSCAA